MSGEKLWTSCNKDRDSRVVEPRKDWENQKRPPKADHGNEGPKRHSKAEKGTGPKRRGQNSRVPGNTGDPREDGGMSENWEHMQGVCQLHIEMQWETKR